MKTNCYSLTHHNWKMSPHYLVKCTTFSSDWRYVAFLQTLVALKKCRLGWGLVALKRTGTVWQMECQTSNVTANVQSDHILHGYMLPVFLPLMNCIVHHALLKFSSCRNKTLPQLVRIADWYSIRMKIRKKKKLCILQGSVVTFFRGGGKRVCFLLK